MTLFENELRSELRRIADTLVITSPASFVFADLPEVSVDVTPEVTASNSRNVDGYQDESELRHRTLV